MEGGQKGPLPFLYCPNARLDDPRSAVYDTPHPGIRGQDRGGRGVTTKAKDVYAKRDLRYYYIPNLKFKKGSIVISVARGDK